MFIYSQINTEWGRVSRAMNSLTREGCRAFPEFFKKNPDTGQDVTLEFGNIKLIYHKSSNHKSSNKKDYIDYIC